MRRNNGWLAVLALSVVLSILRNSLAGERYPLDYANAELPVNLNETVYEARIPNRAILNSENQSNSTSWNSPKLSSTIKPSSVSSSSFPEKENTISTKDSSKVISWRANKVADTNLPDEDRNDDRSFFENAFFDSIHDESKHEDPTEDIFTEQSNKLRTSKSKVQVVKRSSSFDTGIPRLSTWIGGGTIKDISKRSKHVTRRFTGSITTRRKDRETLGAIQRRGELAERGFPYYGHVKVSLRDDNSLTISTGEKGAKGFTKDPRGNGIERSDTVNGRQTTKDVEKGDIESSRSSKGIGLSEKIVDKRYSSRRNSVFPGLVDGELDEKYEERKLTREKLDGRLVYSLMNDRQRSRRSIQNSRQIPGEKSGISTAGRVINLKAKYFSRDSRSSNRDSGNDRFEADGREWASHHSSRFGGSPYALVSHKSTTERRRPWNTRQSNGISSKQRSTIGNDDPRDSGTQYSSSIRGKRNSVWSGEKLTSNSSGNEETSSNVTFHGATNDSLDNNKVDNENDVEERLEFKFTREDFNKDVESNSTDRSEDNATVLNNESELINFDGIELKNFVLNASNESDSQLEDVDNSRNSTLLDVQQFTSSTLNNSKLEIINEFDSINHDVNGTSTSGKELEENFESSVTGSEIQKFNTTNPNIFNHSSNNTKFTPNTSTNTLLNYSINHNVETTTSGGKIEEKFESDSSESEIQVFNLTSLNTNEYSSNDTELTVNISTSSSLNYSINHDVDETSTSGTQLDEKLNFNSTNLNISKHFSNDTKATSTKNNTKLETRSSTFRNETITIVPPTKDSFNETKFNRSLNNTEHTSTVSNTNNSISTNKSVSANPDKRTAFTDRTKLDTSAREIDVPADEANKTMPEGVSTLSNVTKQAEDVFVNSLRSSVAAPRNVTYLRHDMNSLAVASFAWKSTSPSQYDGRNADDPFRNSSTVKSSRIVENFKIIAHPERSFINPMEQTKSKPSMERTNESRSVISKMYQSEKQRINDEAVGTITSMESTSSSNDPNANMHKGKHNGTVIVGKNEVVVSSKSTVPLNQNTQLDISEIKANEPTIGILSKNATRAQPLSASSLDNGTVNEVNPRGEDKGNIDDLSYRSTFDPVSTVTVLINDHPMKERRKSRSSKTGETSLGYEDAGMKIEYSLTSETSTSMWSNDTVPRDTVSSREIDSFPEKADNDVSETITLDQPMEFISRIANNSEENILSMENVTFPSTDVYQYSNEVEASTVVTTNEEDEQLLHFDMIVSSSLEPNDEDFHVTVDDVSSQGIDNSSHEAESRNQWPVKHSAVVEGDLVLGGLMMVHEREDSVTCGPVMPQGGVQALEAMLYTLDRLNDREIVPGVKIGAHILDDCDKDTYGLEMAVDFIKGM
ncbi:Metabotropic glutamate receptor 2 [Anthophora retusa]